MNNNHEELSRGLHYFNILSELDKKDSIGFKKVLERASERVRSASRNDPEGRDDNQLLADLLKWIERELGDRFRVNFSKFYQPVKFRGSVLVTLACFFIGIASNFLGPSNKVNLLWNPFSLLIAWNAFVATLGVIYFLFVLCSKGQGRVSKLADCIIKECNQFFSLAYEWCLKCSARLSRLFGVGFKRGPHGLFRKTQFVSKLQWLQHHQQIRDSALSLRFHWWAAVFMAGVVSGLCFRGLVIRYSFVWESTFIQSEHTLREFLGAVFAPVLLLPTFPNGLPSLNGTENAKWIILLSLSAFVYVIIPRLLLAASSFYRLRALRADLDPSKKNRFAKSLLAKLKQLPLQLHLYSFSYQLDQDKLNRLKVCLNTLLPGKLTLSVYQNLIWEDPNVKINSETDGPSLWAICMNGVQTPESEAHGAFLSSVWREIEACEHDKYVLILIDNKKINVDRENQRFVAWEKLIAQTDPKISFACVDLCADLQGQHIQNLLAEALWSSD